jgi:hypothetical protein
VHVLVVVRLGGVCFGETVAVHVRGDHLGAFFDEFLRAC